MTKASDESDQPEGIGDDQLPEDLQPGEDNPLAVPLEPGETSEVDLNEPSRSYAKEQEQSADESGAEAGDTDEPSGAPTDE